jgi:hypothetical protein
VSRDIEDLVRDTQERFANQAVHPERIRVALPDRAASKRRRRRRYGAAGIVAAAFAVTAAVTVPALALGGGGGGGGALSATGAGQQQAAGPRSTSQVATVPGAAAIALRYQPTWLPAGLRERVRNMSVPGTNKDSTLLRTWTAHSVGSNGDGTSVRLDLTVRRPADATDPQANTGVRVDINGSTGYYHGAPQGETKSYVEWRAGADAVVSISQVGLHLSEADMLKVARSVKPDPAQMQLPLRLEWLPDGMSLSSAEIGGDSATSWYASLWTQAAAPASLAPKEAKQGPRSLSVALRPTASAGYVPQKAPGTPTTGGEQLTVGGHPAQLIPRTDLPGTNMWYLVVHLDNGQLLTVIAEWPDSDPLTKADLVKVAENAVPVTPPDVTWIGK